MSAPVFVDAMLNPYSVSRHTHMTNARIESVVRVGIVFWASGAPAGRGVEVAVLLGGTSYMVHLLAEGVHAGNGGALPVARAARDAEASSEGGAKGGGERAALGLGVVQVR